MKIKKSYNAPETEVQSLRAKRRVMGFGESGGNTQFNPDAPEQGHFIQPTNP